MQEAVDHYERLLGERYTWMLGGDPEALVAEREALLRDLLDRAPHGPALDLGCGPGLEAMALARLGYTPVLAVDASPTLLAELAERLTGPPEVHPVLADLAEGLPEGVAPGSVAVAVCLGDTLPHLPDVAAAERLLVQAAGALRPGGLLVVSLRDHTRVLVGDERFLPVRADDDAVLTCFLEDEGERVRVHDLLHVRTGGGTWELRTSSYPKLRIGPAWVAERLQAAGLTVEEARAGARGTWFVVARKPA